MVEKYLLNAFAISCWEVKCLPSIVSFCAMNVGPCHHGMVRPQVADGGTASCMEGSCE